MAINGNNKHSQFNNSYCPDIDLRPTSLTQLIIKYIMIVTCILGRRPMNLRSVSLALLHIGWRRLAQWIPYWIKTPKILLSLAGNKF